MKSPNFPRNLMWSQLWMPTVIDLIGHFSGAWAHLLMDVTGSDDDYKLATDLMSRRARVAVRVREPGFAQRFYWQITVTAWRQSGAQTEFVKLLENGDLMFYGHATAMTPDHGSITPWFFVDLKRWRQIEQAWRHEAGHQKNRNGAGEECRWYWYDIRNLVYADPRVLLSASTVVPPLRLKEVDR